MVDSVQRAGVADVIANIDTLEANTDGIETKLDTLNASLTRAYATSATIVQADTSAITAGEVVAADSSTSGALTFANAGSGAGEYMITSTTLYITGTSVISGETSYTLHLYSVTPPSATLGNAAWDLPAGDRASYLGKVDLGTVVDVGSTLFVEVNGVNKQITLAGTSVFGYLVTNGSYTQAARSFVIGLHLVKL